MTGLNRRRLLLGVARLLDASLTKASFLTEPEILHFRGSVADSQSIARFFNDNADQIVNALGKGLAP